MRKKIRFVVKIILLKNSVAITVVFEFSDFDKKCGLF